MLPLTGRGTASRTGCAASRSPRAPTSGCRATGSVRRVRPDCHQGPLIGSGCPPVRFARPGAAVGDPVGADLGVYPGAVGLSRSGAPGLRAGAGAPQPISKRKSRGDALPHEVRYFWMMLLIAAKYAWRQPYAQEMALLPLLTGAYAAAHALVGKTAAPVPQLAAVGEPAQKLALLRALAGGMVGLMAALPGGAGNAGEDLLPAVARYLAMVEIPH